MKGILTIILLNLSFNLGESIVAQKPEVFTQDTVIGAKLYLYMPRFKSVPKFNAIHLNGKQVFAVTGISRLEYTVLSEGVLQVSNAKNVRVKGASSLSINVIAGGSYYIKVDRKGKLLLQTNPTLASVEYNSAEIFTSASVKIQEDRVLPIPGMSIARETERRAALAELEKLKLEETEKEVEEAIKEFFEELKKKKELNDHIQPRIEVEVQKGPVGSDGYYTYNLRTSYSYDFDAEEGVSAELVNYPSGSYVLETSKAALATANAMRESIDRYLYKYFEPGSIIKIRIVGSADSSPIRRPITYKEEYANISGEEYYITDDYDLVGGDVPAIDSLKLDETSLNTEPTVESDNKYGQERVASITDHGNTFATNEDLAFLRAKGIQYFIESKVNSLSKTKNEYLFQVKIEDGVGGNYRKVVIELLIEDILRGK